jgi:2-hydroxy-3-keto-5-methylthiopentenyl-1-phosphate phosphatase
VSHCRAGWLSDLKRSVILSDFDNTIVNIDTAAFALNHFADPSWKRIEVRFEAGNISFEDSIREEYAMIDAPENVILNELDKVASLRPHFDELLGYCRKNDLPFTVVSAGLEFSIRHFLNQKSWVKFIEIYAPKAEYTGHGYRVSFPKFFNESSINFKHDLVKYRRKRGSRVIFIGDGLGDIPAAKEADLRFAIKGSKLAEACLKGNAACTEVTDFQEVIDEISSFIG